MDYLDEDKPIRGQNYVCLSFISPEDVIRNKEVYYLEEYFQKLSTDLNQFFENMFKKYPDDLDLLKQIKENHNHLLNGDELQEDFKFFKKMNNERIEKEYLEKNNFQTTIRGIKVRGSFETLKEAQVRAEVLRKMGDKFDIYVGQVGVWCPWSPNPEELQQEYAEEQLNALMKQYKDNLTMKDAFYEQRKEEKMQEAQEKLKKALEKKDTWTERKEQETETENVENTVIETENVEKKD